MRLRTIVRRKALLPLLLLATVAVAASAAGADQRPAPRPGRDGQAVADAIRSGKARKVPTPPGRAVRTLGVWHGCRFVYVKSNVSTYRTDDGTTAEVSEAPEPLPEKDPGCIEREPTVGEIEAMRAQIGAATAAARTPGAPPPPTLPPARSRNSP